MVMGVSLTLSYALGAIFLLLGLSLFKLIVIFIMVSLLWYMTLKFVSQVRNIHEFIREF